MWEFGDYGTCQECELYTKINVANLCELCYML